MYNGIDSDLESLKLRSTLVHRRYVLFYTTRSIRSQHGLRRITYTLPHLHRYDTWPLKPQALVSYLLWDH